MDHDAWVTLTNVAQTFAIAFLLATVWIQQKQIDQWAKRTTWLATVVMELTAHLDDEFELEPVDEAQAAGKL